MSGKLESDAPALLAVKCGRIVFCVAGAVLLAVAGSFAYVNPDSQLALTATVFGAGFALVWLGIALPPKAVAHLGLWLLMLLP
jgi:hypothetical protein